MTGTAWRDTAAAVLARRRGASAGGPWFALLSQKFRVIAPWHPGYGNSPLIEGSGSVDDLAYLYLDLAAELKLDNTVLVSACFGGWVASEMMVRSTGRFSHLVPVDPLGPADLHGWSPLSPKHVV